MDEPRAEEPKQQSIPEMIAELLQLIATFAREQVRIIVERSAADPLKRAAAALFTGIIAAFVFGIAIIFLAVAAFLLLLEFIPAWAAVGLIGVVLIIIGLLMIRRGGKR